MHVSESSPPTPASPKVAGGRWETYEPAVWFLAVDSRGIATTGDVQEWRAPVVIIPEPASTPEGYLLAVRVRPRSAEVRVSFDGSSPKDGQVLAGRIGIPDDAQHIIARYLRAKTARTHPQEHAAADLLMQALEMDRM